MVWLASAVSAATGQYVCLPEQEGKKCLSVFAMKNPIRPGLFVCWGVYR